MESIADLLNAVESNGTSALITLLVSSIQSITMQQLQCECDVMSCHVNGHLYSATHVPITV